MPDRDRGRAAEGERGEFLCVGAIGSFQEQPGEDAEEARRDRGQRAQVTLGIEVDVVFAARQILEVEVVGEILARLVAAGDACGRRLEGRLDLRGRRVG